MKEAKKTATKRNTTSSSKNVAQKSKSTRVDTKKNEPPKVKKVDVEEINKDFEDVESEDKRLIVFISIAILVIVGTIIGLLVGCEKKKNSVDEPDKPNTDVVVPEKSDEEDDGVVTREVVRKVRTVYKFKKKTNSTTNNNDDEEEENTYNVTFYLGEESETEEVGEGEDFPEFVPKGYSSCMYYKDENLTEEYDITSPVTENVNVYMTCEVIEYSVVYESSNESATITTSNPTTYSVEDGEIELTNPEVSTSEIETELYFDGWFTDESLTSEVNGLSKDLVDSADEGNVIHIYAKITDECPSEEDPEEEPTITEEGPTEEGPTEEGPTEEGPTEEGPIEEGLTEEDVTVEQSTAPKENLEEVSNDEEKLEEAPSNEEKTTIEEPAPTEDEPEKETKTIEKTEVKSSSNAEGKIEVPSNTDTLVEEPVEAIEEVIE